MLILETVVSSNKEHPKKSDMPPKDRQKTFGGHITLQTHFNLRFLNK